MDRLWSPWRYDYITAAGPSESQSIGCVFCSIRDDPDRDEANFVVFRGGHNFVVLNIYPYTSGHTLIVPYEHVGALDAAAKQTTDELMDLTKRCQTAVRAAYQPAGFNIGMNLGKAAGAGIADHIHIHILPRWEGDTNFMSTVGDTRVIPEDLTATYHKIRSRF